MEYLEEYDCEDTGFGPSDKIQENLKLVKWLAFNGHTHRPGIITEDINFLKPEELEMPYKLGKEKAIINIGSVGQPRDGDTRSCFRRVRNYLSARIL